MALIQDLMPSFTASLAFSPDSTKLLASSFHSGAAIQLWECATGTLLVSIEMISNPILKPLSLAFSPSRDRFVVSYEERSIQVWTNAEESVSLLETIKVGSMVNEVSFHSDERYLETERGLVKMEPIPSSSATSTSAVTIKRRNAIFFKEN